MVSSLSLCGCAYLRPIRLLPLPDPKNALTDMNNRKSWKRKKKSNSQRGERGAKLGTLTVVRYLALFPLRYAALTAQC